MSARVVARVLAGLSVALVLMAFLSGLIGIWSGDERWGYTALLVGVFGLVGSFLAAVWADVAS